MRFVTRSKINCTRPLTRSLSRPMTRDETLAFWISIGAVILSTASVLPA